MSDQIDLDRTYIAVELRPDDGIDGLPALVGNLPSLNALLRKVRVVLRDLAEGAIENRHVVLDAEAQVGVLIESAFLRRVDIRCFKGNRLVAVPMVKLDPAVPLFVRAAEDDEPGFELLNAVRKAMGKPPTVQNSCIFRG